MAGEILAKQTARKTLMTGCAMATALSLPFMSETAGAAPGGFQGTPTIASGTAVFSSNATSTTIDIGTSEAVINWTPFDTATGGGPIAFLDAGRSALFRNADNTITNFTVLNRIVPSDATRAIRFDGLVQSRIVDAGGASTPGGNVWFYSPGGIILGATSVFDIGSLVLSAVDIDTSGGLLGNPAARTIRFRGASGSTSAIDVNAGAQIIASTQGSYVALVAPRIVQSGVVNVDGSVGYIAAEQVDVRINNGLFDIEFLTGTGASATPVIHDGTTTGPAGTNNRIYVAAFPKNDAITMLVSGTLGYTPAATATTDNGQIVLSAGQSVFESGIGSGGGLGISDIASSISIGPDTSANTTFNSSVTARATGDITVAPKAGLGVAFKGGASLNAQHRVDVTAVNNAFVNVGQGLGLYSANLGTGAGASLVATSGGVVSVSGNMDVQGGAPDPNDPTRPASARVLVDGGSVSSGGYLSVTTASIGAGGNSSLTVGGAGSSLITGDIFVDARATNPFFGSGTDAVGGTASFVINGGALVAGNVNVNGSATSGVGFTATGGTTRFEANGGSITLGSLSVNADVSVAGEGGGARGDGGQNGPAQTSGPAGAGLVGGTAELVLNNTTMTVTGQINISADADKGNLPPAPGEIIGGNANVKITGGSLTAATLRATADSYSSGIDEQAATDAARGGTVSITPDNTTITITDSLNLSASAFGDSGSFSGGNAFGGSVTIAPVNGGSFRALGQQGDNFIAADGFGGKGLTGGNGTGGTITLTAINGALELGGVTSVSAAGIGGTATSNDFVSGQPGLAGGVGHGGIINVSVGDAGGISGRFKFGSLLLTASSFLQDFTGGFFLPGGAGGSAEGGTINFAVKAGIVTGTSLALSADATGGKGGNAESGTNAGEGGSGTAGQASLLVSGGTSTIGSVVISAVGVGGTGGVGVETGYGSGTGANGGQGDGGTAEAIVSGGNLRAASLTINTIGTGGSGGNSDGILAAGDGGDGSGGTSRLVVSSGGALQYASELDMGSTLIVNLNAYASGGSGGSGSDSGDAGSGGAGQGGIISASLAGNFAFDPFVKPRLFLDATGQGGNGGFINTSFFDGPFTANAGAGGAGIGGAATVSASGTALSIENLFVNTSGGGGFGGTIFNNTDSSGFGGTGGAANAGVALVTTSIDATVDNLSINADAFGGGGGDGATGGNSGDALNTGSATFTVTGGTTNIGGISLSATAQVGDAGSGFAGNSGTGGAATASDATIQATGPTSTLTLGNLSMNASATGGEGGASTSTIILGSGGKGGNAQGGTASVLALGGSVLRLNGSATVLAHADGGHGDSGSYFSTSGAGGAGGNATGGTVNIDGTGGFLSIDQLNASADGDGGYGGDGGRISNFPAMLGAGGIGGAGTAGSLTAVGLTLASSGQNFFATADGIGGDGGRGDSAGAGGNGLGGTSNFALSGDEYSISGLRVSADGEGGFGGSSDFATSGAGGNGTGGSATAALSGGVDGLFVNSAYISASGFGSDGAGAANGRDGARGGNGAGGIASLDTAGRLNFANLTIRANAVGGRGSNGGSGTYTSGFENGGNGGAGGTAAGGQASLIANSTDGDVSVGDFSIFADATGGRGGDGGYGITDTDVPSFGGNAASGGTAVGGAVDVTAGAGSLTLMSGEGIPIQFRSSGSGGAGGFGGLGSEGDYAANGTGGAGTGGNARIGTNGAALTLGNVLIDASGSGGGVGIIAERQLIGGGAGTGASAELYVNGGSLRVGDVTIQADGVGGVGADSTAASGAQKGGAGTGGSARVTAAGNGNAFDFTSGIITLTALGSGGSGGNGSATAASGSGGAGTGGLAALSFDFDPVLANVSLDASGIGGIGGSGLTGGAGGAGSGGSGINGARITLGFGDLTITTANVVADGTGGAGGDGIAGAGGTGGAGHGGDVSIQANNAGSNLSITSLTITANAYGGTGGVSGGAAALSGAKGGNATGGNASIFANNGATIQLDVVDSFTADAIGGTGSAGTAGIDGITGANGASGTDGVLGINGGNGSSGGFGGTGTTGATGGSGGAGGKATGGNLSINASNGGAITTGVLVVSATGLGGTGGVGGVGGRGGDGGLGGSGGRGADNFTFTPPFTGGNGGDGGSGGSGGNGGTGGDGGAGGEGVGGSVLLRSDAGTLKTGDLTVTADGTSSVGGFAGAGGAGGTEGVGGSGGLRGESGYGAPGIGGNAGASGSAGTAGSFGSFNNYYLPGAGGTIRLESQGSADLAVFESGATVLSASGLNTALGNYGFSGSISISNVRGDQDQADLKLDSLDATADGFGGGAISLTADGAVVSVAGNANLLSGGDISVFANDIGQWKVGGDIDARAQSTFLSTHVGRAADGDTIVGLNVSIVADSYFDAQSGTRIRARDALKVQSRLAFLTAADLQSVSVISAFAGSDATIGDAQTTGIPSAGLPFPVRPGLVDIRAGYTENSPPYFIATATINGTIQSTGDTLVTSGGDIVVNSSARLLSDNRILLASGDDVFINDGAALTSGRKPIAESGYGSTGKLDISAGTVSKNGTVTDDVASIIIGNATLTATNNVATLFGGAIQASRSTFIVGEFTATVANAPTIGDPVNNDNGQLTVACVAGNICLGSVNATFDPAFPFASGSIEVGPSSGTFGLPNSVSVSTALNGEDIVVRARDTITLGAVAADTIFNARNSLFVASLGGDINLLETAALSSGSGELKLYANGALNGPLASIRSDTNVGLFAGGLLSLGAVDAGGALQTINSDGSVENPVALNLLGGISIGKLLVRGGDAILNSGTQVAVGSAGVSDGYSVFFSSYGATELGASDQVFGTASNISLSGATVVAGALLAASNINLSSSSTINAGNLSAGNSVRADASGDINTGDIFATSDVVNLSSINGGISTGNIAGMFSVFANAPGDITLGDVSVVDGALTILSGGTATLGNLTAFGFGGEGFPNIGVEADSINMGFASADGDISLRANLGTITAGNLQSNSSDIFLDAQGVITTGDLTALLGSVTISNVLGTITTGLIGVGNDFTITTASDLMFAGVSAGDDIRITTNGKANLGRLTARGTGTDNESDASNIVLNIGGDATVSHAEATNNFTASAGRLETGLNTIITGGDIDIVTVGDSVLGNSTAGGHISVNAGGLVGFNDISAGSFTSLIAGTSVTGGSSVSGNYFLADGASVDIGSATARPSLTIFARNGILNLGSGTAGPVAGNISLYQQSANALTAGTLTADGDILVSSAGGAVVNNATARGNIGNAAAPGTEGNIFITAFGAATLNTGAARTDIGVTGTSVSGTASWVAGEDILAVTAGTASLGNLTAGDNIDVQAIGGIALGSATTTGAARDDRALTLFSGEGLSFFITGASPDSADVTLTSNAGNIAATALSAGDDITISSGGSVTIGSANSTGLVAESGYGAAPNGANLLINASGSVTFGTGIAANNTTINGQSLTATSLSAGNVLQAALAQGATIGTASGTNLVQINGSTDISVGTANSSAGDVLITSFGGNVALGGGTIFHDLQLYAFNGTISQTGAASAGNDVVLNAQQMTLGSISAGRDLSIFANDVTATSLTAGRDITAQGGEGGNFSAVAASAGDDIRVDWEGNVSFGTAVATGAGEDSEGVGGEGNNFGDGANIVINSGGAIGFTTSGTAATDILLNGASLTAGTLDAGNNIDITTAGFTQLVNSLADGSFTVQAGATNLGAIDAGDITVTSGLGVIFASMISDDFVDLTAGDDVIGGPITAADEVLISAGRLVTIGNVTTPGSLIAIDAVTGITTGDLTAPSGSVDLATTGGDITTGFITVQDDLTLTNGANITLAGASAGDDIRITAGGTGAFGRLFSRGTGTDNESDASNIVLDISGNAFVSHAEASNNFTARAARFETGLNTIITGGDIDIVTVGDSLLGNSMAGGHISVNAGGLIDFNDITAGSFTALIASTSVTGGSSVSGSSFLADGGSVDIGSVRSRPSLTIIARNGTLNLGAGTAGPLFGNISLTQQSANALTAGTLIADGDISVSSAGSALVNNATARGSNVAAAAAGIPLREGNIFITALGLATLNTASAKTDIGIAGTSVSGTGSWVAGEDILAVTAGTASLGSLTSGDNIDIQADGGISLGMAAATGTGRDDRMLTLTSGQGQSFFITSGGQDSADVNLTSSGGDIVATTISAGDDITISSAGSVTVNSATSTGLAAESGYGATPDGANLDIAAGGPVTLGSGTAAKNIGITGQSLTAISLTAGNDVAATLTGSATIGTVTGTGVFDGASNATITAPGGITITRTDVVGTVDLSAANSTVLVTTDLKATGPVTATGRVVDLTTIGTLNLANALATDGNVTVTAGGMTAAQARARGDIRLTSTSSDILAGALTTGTGIGAAAGGTPGPGDIVLNSAGNATLSGTANAQRNLNVTARNRIQISSLATGALIDLKSADIAIGATATVGEQGRTGSVTLTNTGNSVTNIGGSGVTTGYSLSNAEAQRLFGGNIFIIAPRVTAGTATGQSGTALNSRAPDVILDTLTLTGANGQTGAAAGNIGTNGILRIQTPGKLRTVGAVSLTNLTGGNRFQIAADETIEVDAATGSIALRGTQNALGGRLELTSADVIAASAAAIGDVISATDIRAVTARLGTNDSAVNDDGYLSADTIVVTVSNGFYVQNSGTLSGNARNFDDRRGLTVGTGGLNVLVENTAARIVINGRQVSAAASSGFLTGIDFLKQVSFNGSNQTSNAIPSGLFDQNSTINGCAILSPASCQVTFDNGNITRDVIQGVVNPDLASGSGDGELPFSLLTIKEVEALPFQPVIDDPVTGSGNDDLWAIDDGKDCPEGEICAQ